MSRDISFSDINLNAYHALEGFTNEQSIIYTRLLNKVMKVYDNIPSLNKMNKDKVKNIKKNEKLLGAEEFLKYNWLDTIHNYSPMKEKNKAIIDGTSRYFGQAFDVLETRPILEWLYSLNNEHGSLQLNFKKPEAILIKLFIRGKTCDDICRASYISRDFTHLFNSLDNLSKKIPDFDYWIEDDRGKTNWNAVKIYLMRTKKSIYGKYIAFELQLITPEMLIIKNQSTNHVNYERMRLARDANVLNLYKSLNINFDTMCSRLKLNSEMCDLMDIVLNLGNFVDMKGQFISKELYETHEISMKHEECSLILDPLEEGSLIFGSYQKIPETKFQIVNGKMICVGSCNHYLTKQRIKLEPLKIKINFIGNDIKLQFSPSPDCGWVGKHKGQTVGFSKGHDIWIRNKIYNITDDTPQVYYNNNIHYLDTDKYIHEMIVTIHNGEACYKIDGKEILNRISLQGAEVLDQGFFHFGFCCWSEKPVTTILNMEITKL